MTITKRGFICLAAGMLVASLFAGHHHNRPLPHQAPKGAYWCPKCDGDGYNRTWYGRKKTCGVCDGRGWLVKNIQPPVVVPHPHHGKPTPKVAPTPAHKASPTPVHKPAPKSTPKGDPRR